MFESPLSVLFSDLHVRVSGFSLCLENTNGEAFPLFPSQFWSWAGLCPHFFHCVLRGVESPFLSRSFLFEQIVIISTAPTSTTLCSSLRTPCFFMGGMSALFFSFSFSIPARWLLTSDGRRLVFSLSLDGSTSPNLGLYGVQG